MAKVSYAPDAEQIAEGDLPESTEQFGYMFEKGKSVEVANPAHIRKFAGHPHFKVSGTVPDAIEVVRTAAERESATLGQSSQEVVTGVAKVVPAVEPVATDAGVTGLPQGQIEQGPDKITPGQADAPSGDTELRAVHRGHGSYSVVEGDRDEEVLPGLSAAEAEEFNNLKAKQKADYLKRRLKPSV